MCLKHAASSCRSGSLSTATTKLIVNSISEAEAHIASMQRFLTILFERPAHWPLIWSLMKSLEKKRYGMLGQLVNRAGHGSPVDYPHSEGRKAYAVSAAMPRPRRQSG